MAFKDIFKDKNDMNEKTIVGFASFIIMTVFAITNIVMGILGKELIVNESVYNAFLTITLGSFGIAEVGKIFNKDKVE
jgi:hypothetical protein